MNFKNHGLALLNSKAGVRLSNGQNNGGPHMRWWMGEGVGGKLGGREPGFRRGGVRPTAERAEFGSLGPDWTLTPSQLLTPRSTTLISAGN